MRTKLKLFLAPFLLTATKPVVGGQAVMEGVMMRSPKSFAVAVRRPDQSIVVRERAWLSFSARLPFLRWPIFRGAAMLIESIYNGMSALQFSAEQAFDALADEKKAPQKVTKNGVDLALLVTMAGSLLLGLAIFKAVPHFITFAIGEILGTQGQSALPITSVYFHLVDGSVKISLFISYILLISRFNDVKRLFMYHGAEHKAVHAFEKNLPLDVEHARMQPTAHPRCGTSLIVLVMAVSILVFSLLLPQLPKVSDNMLLQSLFALAVKIPLMLPIAGIAYEFQRAAAKYPHKLWIRFFIAPGMFMQRLTTRQPDDLQLEISLAALKKALWRENCAQVLVSPGAEEIENFASFNEVCERMA